MRVTGIVAEFNPLHHGHQYLIDYARNIMHSDYVIIVMSGDFTQRGIPAVCSKYDRTSMALSCGADLVLEIPAIMSTSSAQLFAGSAVTLLHKTGIVTDIIFGAENDDMDSFEKLSTLLLHESNFLKENLNLELNSGISYPKALSRAIYQETKDDALTAFINNPNNILGIEYIKTLKMLDSNIKAHCVLRKDCLHSDSMLHSQVFASSMALRNELVHNSYENIHPFVPEVTFQLVKKLAITNSYIDYDDISVLLHDRLYSKDSFEDILDCTPDLSHRILKKRDEFVSASSFINTIASKNLTQARISRILCHILLQYTYDDLSAFRECDLAPYLKVLGFRKEALPLFHLLKEKSFLPIITSPARLPENFNQKQQQYLQLDLRAFEIYRILSIKKTGCIQPTEYTRKFEIFSSNDEINEVQ